MFPSKDTLYKQTEKATKSVLLNGYYPYLSESGASSNRLNSMSNGVNIATTANELITALDVTGAGYVSLLGLHSNDATGRTIRLKVTVDGNTVYDLSLATSTVAETLSPTTFSFYAPIISTMYHIFNDLPIVFNKSLKVEVSSSLTEASGIKIHYRYQLR